MVAKTIAVKGRLNFGTMGFMYTTSFEKGLNPQSWITRLDTTRNRMIVNAHHCPGHDSKQTQCYLALLSDRFKPFADINNAASIMIHNCKSSISTETPSRNIFCESENPFASSTIA